MGQVCQKHQEFYESQCRWCEPVMRYPPIAEPTAPAAPPSAPPHRMTGGWPMLASYTTYIPVQAVTCLGGGWYSGTGSYPARPK